MNLSQEQLRKVRAARSPRELGELARAEGMTLTPEEARAHFAKLNPPRGSSPTASWTPEAAAAAGTVRPLPTLSALTWASLTAKAALRAN